MEVCKIGPEISRFRNLPNRSNDDDDVGEWSFVLLLDFNFDRILENPFRIAFSLTWLSGEFSESSVSE